MRGGSVFRKFFWLFVILPAGVVCVAFSLANRHMVTLNLDPFATQDLLLTFNAPFYRFLLAALLFGVLLGGLVTWLGQGKWRKTARRRATEIAGLRRQTDQLNEQLRIAARPRIGEREAAE
jgi:hypothetical protein